MTGYNAFDPFRSRRHLQDIEQLILECKRRMGGIYSPDVITSLIELAKRRCRLNQLRGIVASGLALTDNDLRRILMADTYISPNTLTNLVPRD